MESCVSRRAVSTRSALLLPVAFVLAGCDLSLGHLTARATDEWTRSYPLEAGGEVRIVNTNGKIDIEGTDGSTVEVRAERIARGATDAAARELLPRIVIKEDIKPDRVWLETERMSGIMIGAAFEVRYHVRAPKRAVVNVTNTNGQVALAALDGKVKAQTTNGGVNGRSLSGGVDARSTNGGVTIDMASVGPDSITLRTTNGGVTLTLPDRAKANLTASCTNGGINVSSLENLEISEQSRRRVEGRLNGGGTSIEVRTTNGGIRVRPRNSAESTRTAEDEKSDR
jgi:putative adhesin